MPSAKIDGPVIRNIDIKRTLVKEITEALQKAYKHPRESYVVVIKENSPDNVGIGGTLASDKKKV